MAEVVAGESKNENVAVSETAVFGCPLVTKADLNLAEAASPCPISVLPLFRTTMIPLFALPVIVIAQCKLTEIKTLLVADVGVIAHVIPVTAYVIPLEAL